MLENGPPWAHIIRMAENHPFTVRVEPDLLRPGRFRWTLYENGQPRNRSIVSYPTERDADADATKALDKEIANWRLAR